MCSVVERSTQICGEKRSSGSNRMDNLFGGGVLNADSWAMIEKRELVQKPNHFSNAREASWKFPAGKIY
jgi:hypothetical protein